MRRLLPAVLPLAVATAVLAAPAVVHADTVWLCRPGATPNPCEGSLRTTVRTFGKPSKVVTPKAIKDPGFDCFYVYPTVSQQPGPAANLAIEPAEISIASYQAARFSQICKVYAPMYRQITLTALLTGTATQADRDNAYADVKAAFEEYRAANPGRPFTLIGHSQGSGMLKRLMQDVIEPDPALRSQMVSALITGSTVSVPVGKAVGGDFQNIPVCTRNGQVNCIISFATFGQKPPKNSFFGRTQMGAGYEAACTNPTSLAKNKPGKAVSYMRGNPIQGLLATVAAGVFNNKVPTAKTAWLRPRDRYTAQCVKSGKAHVLMVKPIGTSMKLSPAPSDSWGLHLLDLNLPLGNLIDVVRTQQQAYQAG
jgi:hypothetical protein